MNTRAALFAVARRDLVHSSASYYVLTAVTFLKPSMTTAKPGLNRSPILNLVGRSNSTQVPNNSRVVVQANFFGI